MFRNMSGWQNGRCSLRVETDKIRLSYRWKPGERPPRWYLRRSLFSAFRWASVCSPTNQSVPLRPCGDGMLAVNLFSAESGHGAPWPWQPIGSGTCGLSEVSAWLAWPTPELQHLPLLSVQGNRNHHEQLAFHHDPFSTFLTNRQLDSRLSYDRRRPFCISATLNDTQRSYFQPSFRP